MESKVYGSLKSLCVYNDPELSQRVTESLKKVVGEDHIQIIEKALGSEDFSGYSARAFVQFVSDNQDGLDLGKA